VHTLSFSRFVASRSSGNHDSWHGFSEFYEKPSDPVNCVIAFTKKGASGAKHQIRTAAPHFEMGLGHEWANFNTQSVQTLSFSRFVASRGSANHDGWHGFSKFYETPSDSVIYLIYFTKKVLPEQNIRSAQQRLILKWVWGMGGPNSTHNLCTH
jgi:hypothetical protein